MNYIKNIEKFQVLNEVDNYLILPTLIKDFYNTTSNMTIDEKGKYRIFLNGFIGVTQQDYICPNCNELMHINNKFDVLLKHLNFGGNYSFLSFKKLQFYCEKCHLSKMQEVPFQAEGHRITKELHTFIVDLLNSGHYTNKEISELTGVGKNIIKDIDKKRLLEKYTIDGKELLKPSSYAKHLGIDEFKLHNGHQYATHIVDLETGHILWIAKGRKKNVVYDFIEHVGKEWMEHVEAVACDMNSDFEEAFVDKFPHIKIVFDHFHIVKNFNEKVVTKIYKEEQSRLRKEGNIKEAKALKISKYILTSSRETLKKKDEEGRKNKIVKQGSELFKTSAVTRKVGYEEKYNGLIEENEKFIVVDMIKELLSSAYKTSNVDEMKEKIDTIIALCEENGNKHLLWFRKLIIGHYEGIINHAKYNISTGKVEGINNKIKTIRRRHYGIPDDEYFFLKIIDSSYISSH